MAIPEITSSDAIGGPANPLRRLGGLVLAPFAAVLAFLGGQARIIWSDGLGRVGLVILLLFTLVAIFGKEIAPYEPFQYLENAKGDLQRMMPPSADYLFGTNFYGQDVFSQTVRGTVITLVVGLLTGLLVAVIGTTVGMVAGYFGGWIDAVLMRIVDIFMGVPTLPFAIMVATITGPKLTIMVAIFVLLFWRTSARVIRSSVLTLKSRQYVTAARAAGAGDTRIMLVHILPNILPLAFLYVVFGTAFGVLAEASLSFIGLGDPNVISWGQMINAAFKTASMRQAWWTVVPPCVCLILFLSSVYFVGRAYEEHLNPRLRRRT